MKKSFSGRKVRMISREKMQELQRIKRQREAERILAKADELNEGFELIADGFAKLLRTVLDK